MAAGRVRGDAKHPQHQPLFYNKQKVNNNIDALASISFKGLEKNQSLYW